MPGLGKGFKLIFSAWRAAVAGAMTGAAAGAGRAFSNAAASLSMAEVSRSIFWERWEAQGGSWDSGRDVEGEDNLTSWDEGAAAGAEV